MPNFDQTSESYRANGAVQPNLGNEVKDGPLVSVLLPTYNRRRFLPQALMSALQQSYRNLEIVVINDGGEDVADLMKSFNDPRLVFINRRENRGKPYSLNEGLSHARGKYVAYLDDDDMYYRDHIALLVDTLEGDTDCQVAYSDLYKVYCQVLPNGGRQVLSKFVEVCRDFDRFLMLYFNHVLHVSLMHRRDLLDRTGPYNENLNILIDWDMTRRLAFFSDFHHVPTVTGEFYCPVTDCDRISIQGRKDSREYLRNVLSIRTMRPAKPWPKVDDLSIILLVDHLDKSIADMLVRMWRYTFYPYQVYLPLPSANIARLRIEMPNVIPIPVDSAPSAEGRLDAALDAVEGHYVAVITAGITVEDLWLENPLYALMNGRTSGGLLMEGSDDRKWGVVIRRADLERARKAYPQLSMHDSLAACGISLSLPAPENLPFLFDHLLREATEAKADGDWPAAAQLFEYMGAHFQNELWMKSEAARAYYEARRYAVANRLSCEVNRTRPTVDTLLLEAKIHRQRRDYHAAIRLLGQAETTLAGPMDMSVPLMPSLGTA